ncbi:MAG: ferredoxin [Paraburkholderia sp.]|uniref:ferredoxin n=1 Tax=Paraburkholderia sp. TaxID=1926495 RepID=UPI00131D8025
MKISITPGLCHGHNNCSRLAPDLFELDSGGYAVVRIHSTLPKDLEELAELAAENCPECAIYVENADEHDERNVEDKIS